MNEIALLDTLRRRMSGPLPGMEAQVRMAPRESVRKYKRFVVPEGAKKSAVLMLLYPGPDGIYLPLIERNDYKGVHSRQIGLPGGTWEEADGDLLTTALRETAEEIGVGPEGIEVVGPLSQLYIPVSNYMVQPYVGIIDERPEFIPDPTEVASLIEAPLAHFTTGDYSGLSKIPYRTGIEIEVPGYTIMGHLVWGATAMMMSELVAVLSDE